MAGKTALYLLSREVLRPHWKRVKPLVDTWLATEVPTDPVLQEVLTHYVRRESLLHISNEILQEAEQGKPLDPDSYQRRLEDLNFSFLDERDRIETFTQSRVTYGQDLLTGRVPTGIAGVDSRIRGGLGPGELGIVLAPPKGGKTAALINFEAHAACAGLRCLHVTLEISKMMVIERLDMCIGGLSSEDILDHPEALAKARNRVRRAHGEIVVCDLSHDKVTPDRVLNLISIHHPQIVVVDYADLMVSYTSDDRRAVLGQNYRDLRRIAALRGVPIWTASQGTRDTIEAEEFGLAQTAEDITKTHTADVVLCLMQTPAQRQSHTGRVKVAATRGSAENPIVPVSVDWNIMRITTKEGTKDATQTREGVAAKTRSFHQGGANHREQKP